MTTTTRAQSLARQLVGAFSVKQRPDGSRYSTFDHDRAPWTSERLPFLIHEAVDGDSPRLPDDWIYEKTHEIAAALADYDDPTDDDHAHEIADGAVEVWSSKLYLWAADHGKNRDLIQEAREEFGKADDHEREIMQAQYLALSRIVATLQQEIRNQLNEEEGWTDEAEDDGHACDECRSMGPQSGCDCNNDEEATEAD